MDRKNITNVDNFNLYWNNFTISLLVMILLSLPFVKPLVEIHLLLTLNFLHIGVNFSLNSLVIYAICLVLGILYFCSSYDNKKLINHYSSILLNFLTFLVGNTVAWMTFSLLFSGMGMQNTSVDMTAFSFLLIGLIISIIILLSKRIYKIFRFCSILLILEILVVIIGQFII